jgi:hypothetical protein
VDYNVSAIAFYRHLGFSEHVGKFHTKDWHDLNGKKIPVITMVLERA